MFKIDNSVNCKHDTYELNIPHIWDFYVGYFTVIHMGFLK